MGSFRILVDAEVRWGGSIRKKRWAGRCTLSERKTLDKLLSVMDSDSPFMQVFANMVKFINTLSTMRY